MTTPNPNPPPPMSIPGCPHNHFDASVNTERDTMRITLNMFCKQCGKVVTFQGHTQVVLQGNI